MSKYDMLSVKEIAFVAGNKELDVRFRKQSSCLSQFSFRGSYLAAIGIRTRVGHRQQSCLRVLCNKVFVLKSFSVNAHGACSISLWTFRITTISYLAASYQLLTFKKSPPWTMKSLITLKCNNPSEYITMKCVNILSLSRRTCGTNSLCSLEAHRCVYQMTNTRQCKRPFPLFQPCSLLLTCTRRCRAVWKSNE